MNFKNELGGFEQILNKRRNPPPARGEKRIPFVFNVSMKKASIAFHFQQTRAASASFSTRQRLPPASFSSCVWV